MIKTIIFDIGNVLAGFGWAPYFKTLGYDDAMIGRIAKATVESAVWNEYDRGNMTDEEILDAFVQNDPEIEQELRSSLSNIKGMLVRYDYAIPWIQSLKDKGYQILVLSNFSHKAYTDCADVLDFIPFIDGGILSYREHVIKPDPAIYKLLLDRYGLQPSECIFMDDLQRNIDAARDCGIHAFVFVNQQQAIEELKAYGVA